MPRPSALGQHTMIHGQADKLFIVTAPEAIRNNSSYTTNQIDTLGFRYLRLVLLLGATDAALTAWNLQESDVSGSGFADITVNAATPLKAVGTTGDARLPTATDDGLIFEMFVDLKGRKRYLSAVITVGVGASVGGFYTCLALLSRAEESPNTNAERGITGILRLPA